MFERGAPPYFDLKDEYQVTKYLNFGGHLLRPEHCPEEIYNLMKRCWMKMKNDRPEFTTIKDDVNSCFKKLQTKDLETPINHDYETPISLAKTKQNMI
uniref:Serine-threonine/tyrosine-protein kinase catalytic domain-containing protein n=1 Tax=Panagrolaimus superbus TaxID=310955 RepID=A0A914XR80_9BILA